MTIPDPSYITAEEVKLHTLIAGLKTLSKESITTLIQRAEGQIDKHVGWQEHHPDDENTTRVFPRLLDDDCGSPIIPYDVSMACLAQVEHLYTQWWAKSATTLEPSNREVKSESIGGDGSISVEYAGPARPDDMLCDQAKAYLSGFVNRVVAISVTDPDDVPPPR